MIRINIKDNYILPHFIHVSKQMLLFIAVYSLQTIFRRDLSKRMFFKISVFKSLTIFTGKHLRWNNFIKREAATQLLSYEYCEIFKSNFSQNNSDVCFQAFAIFSNFALIFHFLIFLFVMFSNSYSMRCVFSFFINIFSKSDHKYSKEK